MKRPWTVSILTTLVCGATALAQSGPLPAPKHVSYWIYDRDTHSMQPQTRVLRDGGAAWEMEEPPFDGWWHNAWAYEETALDWGDLGVPLTGTQIAGVRFGYVTNATAGATVDLRLWVNEDGFDSSDTHSEVYGEVLELEGSSDGTQQGHFVTVEFDAPVDIDGADLDEDGLVDFGYSFGFSIDPDSGDAIGPYFSTYVPADPNDPNDTGGCTDWYDSYDDAACTNYTGTWNWGGTPFAQLYITLLTQIHDCPNPGNSGYYCDSDIDGAGDCVIGLADLQVLLSNYGTTSGATHADGDLQPAPDGDGAVNLQDLQYLLSMYGDNCN